MSAPIRSLLTTRQKMLLLLWLLVPAFYMSYLAIMLPAGPTGRGKLPVWMLMFVVPAAWQVLDGLQRMQRKSPAFVRLVQNRNYRKLTLISIGCLNAMYCYYIHISVYPETTDGRWTPGLMSLCMLLVGNYLLPLSRREYMELEITFGTPFMRRYGDLVVQAYRLVARLLVLGGVLGLLAAWQLSLTAAMNVAAGVPVAAIVLAFGVFWVWVAQRRLARVAG